MNVVSSWETCLSVSEVQPKPAWTRTLLNSCRHWAQYNGFLIHDTDAIADMKDSNNSKGANCPTSTKAERLNTTTHVPHSLWPPNFTDLYYLSKKKKKSLGLLLPLKPCCTTETWPTTSLEPKNVLFSISLIHIEAVPRVITKSTTHLCLFRWKPEKQMTSTWGSKNNKTARQMQQDKKLFKDWTFFFKDWTV